MAPGYSKSMAWVRIASVSEMKPGALLECKHNGAVVALCNHEGSLHALDGRCPHRNGPLGQGNLADGRIICPWHAWEFDCRSGEYDMNSDVRLRRYQVRIDGDDVLADLP